MPKDAGGQAGADQGQTARTVASESTVPAGDGATEQKLRPDGDGDVQPVSAAQGSAAAAQGSAAPELDEETRELGEAVGLTAEEMNDDISFVLLAEG